MTERIAGVVTRFNGHTGVIATQEAAYFFRSENRAFISMPLAVGDSVTFRVSPNTAYDAGMDLAVSILVDGYPIPAPRTRVDPQEMTRQRKEIEAWQARKRREWHERREARIKAETDAFVRLLREGVPWAV